MFRFKNIADYMGPQWSGWFAWLDRELEKQRAVIEVDFREMEFRNRVAAAIQRNV